MQPSEYDAIDFVESLNESELNQLVQGERHLVFENKRFQLVPPREDDTHTLLAGGQEWLERRVPPEARKGEAVRRYVISYVQEVFDYVAEEW